MERVTFQDKKLVDRIKARCVATWKNAVPGFETVCLDDPALKGRGSFIRNSLAKCAPGAASANVSTVFSTADGKVLHIAPGALPATDLLRELELALAIDEAVREAGDDPHARESACAAKHTERLAKLASENDVAPTLRPLLARVHETLAKKPLLALDALRPEDYTPDKLDVEATRKSGAEVKEQLVKAFERFPVAATPK
jgi:hypothetical protein